MTEYEPYGQEWEKEMMKLTKKQLIDLFRMGKKGDFVGFADELVEISFEGGDVDGWALQEMAEKYGILKPVEAIKPCGEGCRCAEDAWTFPTTCYRKTYKL